eukprot:gene5906-432_t
MLAKFDKYLIERADVIKQARVLCPEQAKSMDLQSIASYPLIWPSPSQKQKEEWVEFQQWIKDPHLKVRWERHDLWNLWVRGEGASFPALGEDAAIVLACPGHSCDCERAVSAFNNVKTSDNMSPFMQKGRMRIKFNGTSFDSNKS